MGLYSVFAGGVCRQNFVGYETRDAVSGNCFSHGLGLMLMRLAVVAEEERELHLLRMVPLAFLGSGGFDWKNVPTRFGKLSLAVAYQEREGVLEIHYIRPDRKRPVKTALHIPPVRNLRRIVVNGRSVRRTGGEVLL